MTDSTISRRDILAALAAAGGAGAAAGGTTGAILTDSEAISSDQTGPATVAAGEVALDVETNDDGREFVVSLPETGANNPATVWLRTNTCPVPTDRADSVLVELRIECEGDNIVRTGTALEVFTSEDLRTGLRLCPADGCLEPGESRTVTVEQTGTVDGYDGSTKLDFQLLFYSQQCRYATDPQSPFGPTEVLDPHACDDTTTTTSTGYGISWIAFCGDGITTEDVTLDVKVQDEDGSPLVVNWAVTDQLDVDVITWKHGGPGGGEIRKKSVSGTSGTIVWNGGDSAPDLASRNRQYCPEGYSGVKIDGDGDGDPGIKAVSEDVGPPVTIDGGRFGVGIEVVDEITLEETTVAGNLATDISHGDEVKIREDSRIDGDLVGSDGTIVLENSRVVGDVRLKGSKLEIQGSVSIGGKIHADDSGDIDCGGTATINQRSCEEYINDNDI